MTKKIIIIIAAVVIISAGVFYYLELSSRPKVVTFAAAQKLSVSGFIAQIIKIYEIDKKHGLNIEFSYNEPGLTMKKLLNREFDAGIMAPISAAKANLEGQQIRIIGPGLWNVNSLAVRQDSPYRTIDDLKGKKFGILPQITGAYTNMLLLAHEEGWQLESDFKLIIGGLEDHIQFLENGDIDFSIMYDPRASKLIAAGEIREIASLDELWRQFTASRFLFISLAAYDDWISGHRQEAKNLLAVFLEAARFIHDNPSLIAKHKDLLGLETPAEITLAQERIPNLYPTAWNQQMVDDVNLLIKKSVEAGFLDKLPENQTVLMLN